MVKRGTPLPEKLKNDAIVEALLEIRFESKAIPEVFLGRVVDNPHWQGFQQHQLPAYQIPANFRNINPDVRYAPIIELIGAEGKTALRFGPSVLSYHRLAPYDRWATFNPELERVVATLFDTTQKEGVTVKRLGLRYLNALTSKLHQITSIKDLDLKLTVAADEVVDNVNINFTNRLANDSWCTVRIATKDFIQGVAPDTNIFVDVDVYTTDDFSSSDKAQVNKWIVDAHTIEKTEFFRLFTQPTIDAWKEN